MKHRGMVAVRYVRCRTDRTPQAPCGALTTRSSGEVGVLAVDDRTALANTRGRYLKAYRYEDPNEDNVAAVVGPRATLLVCADGHNGAFAPTTAVREVLSAVGDDPPPDTDWLELFGHVNDARDRRQGRRLHSSRRPTPS